MPSARRVSKAASVTASRPRKARASEEDRRLRSRTGSQAPKSAWSFRPDEVERLLRSGEQAALLEEYFGGEEYRALRELSREGAARRARGGPRVLILPGIMGSTLGRRRALVDDVLWIDPVDVAAGQLVKLALREPSPYVPLGVLLFAYLKIKLRLRIAGFDAEFHPFDWRRDIEGLGKELARRIADDPAKQVHVVAHSMGGLVTRAALAAQPRLKIGRFVMLGTPNYGSFAPVQAVRAEYPLVLKIAALDLRHSAEDLAREVFTTFPGLIQMLPSPERYHKVDLYDESAWPADGRPSAAMLRRAREVQELLARPDERYFLIAGVDQRTVTGLAVEKTDGETRFLYEESVEGDGTVPRDCAELPGCATFYVEEEHGSLPNNGLVGDAVIDLLERGETTRLPKQWSAPADRRRRVVDTRQLEATPFEGRRGGELTARDRRDLLREFAAPGSRRVAPAELAPPGRAGESAAAEGGYTHPFQQVVVGRRRQRHIEIRLAQGSITEVRARACVLGVFQGVDPAGAAAAFDERMGGAIKEFTTRRMFSGYVGEVFAMPTGRHLVYADMLLLVGLGPVDGFDDESQQLVTENVVRTLVQTYVDDFAIVLLGGGSGYSVARSLYNHVYGLFRGLREADPDQSLRRITICELSPAKFLEMKQEVFRLASTSLFNDFEVTIDEVVLLPAAPSPATRRPTASDGSTVMYLMVREEVGAEAGGKGEALLLRSTLLTPTGKAAILSGGRSVTSGDLDGLLATIDTKDFTFGGLRSFGEALGELVLDPGVREVLVQNRVAHLVVVHDTLAARIPWETLCVKGWFPAVEHGLSRRYAADDLSIAKWMEERRLEAGLRILLVVNPTEDLEGAEAEAENVRTAFRNSEASRLETLQGRDATRRALLSAFRSGQYDVIHYAGHAYFHPAQPALSGLLCYGDEKLTGYDLAGLAKLPALVFFNACESGRVRGRKGHLEPIGTSSPRRSGRPGPSSAHRVRALIEQNVGLAEAFMRGGVANYVGTYWPVGDAAAARFAETFYRKVAAGESVGVALREGRRTVRELKSVDWADYIHYGTDDFVLKLR